jgi:hypothetical protein
MPADGVVSGYSFELGGIVLDCLKSKGAAQRSDAAGQAASLAGWDYGLITASLAAPLMPESPFTLAAADAVYL